MIPKRPKLEQQLQALEAVIRQDSGAAERGVEVLASALASRNGLLIAPAARYLAMNDPEPHAPAMRTALAELFELGYKDDPGCEGKYELLAALAAFNGNQEGALWRGLRFHQWEPVWANPGATDPLDRGPVDTAGRVRGFCLGQLLRRNHRDAPYEVLTLLRDARPEAREMAVEGAAMLPGREAELLLRYKILEGDTDPRVIYTCFEQLARVAPAQSLDFFEEILRDGQDIEFEAAAIAVGATRDEHALAILSRAREGRLDLERTPVLLRAIGLIRSEEAFDYLLAVLRSESHGAARAAIEALSVWQDDSVRSEAIRQAAQDNGSDLVLAKFRAVFG